MEDHAFATGCLWHSSFEPEVNPLDRTSFRTPDVVKLVFWLWRTNKHTLALFHYDPHEEQLS
jgi:hypothetical protein